MEEKKENRWNRALRISEIVFDKVLDVAKLAALLSLCYAGIAFGQMFYQARSTLAHFDSTLAQVDGVVFQTNALVRELNTQVAGALIPEATALVAESRQHIFEASFLLNENLLYARGVMTNMSEASGAWAEASKEQQQYWAETASDVQQLVVRVEPILDELHASSQSLTRTLESADAVIRDENIPKTLENLEGSTKNLEEATKEVKQYVRRLTSPGAAVKSAALWIAQMVAALVQIGR